MSRPARTASARSCTTRPARPCAATTAVARRRSPPAVRTARSPRIRYLGGGTERVEREVREAHPRLRVARLDRDVADRRGAAERVIDAFTAGDVDVLVGTSLVTKGLDVPTVTLVGVVSSDVALNLPDERAAERTYQLLRQAVGRAGRGDRRGRAILQTYQPDHPVIRAVATGDGDAVLRGGARPAPAVRVTAVRVDRQADRRPTRSRRGRAGR